MLFGLVTMVLGTDTFYLKKSKQSYSGRGIGNCQDIDECTQEIHDCHADATCENTVGSWNCTCNEGYNGTGQVCTDIDECNLGKSSNF